MHTSQLHMIAFTSVGPKADAHFFVAVYAASCAVPPVSSPQYAETRAKPPQPMILPMYEVTQLLYWDHRLLTVLSLRPSGPS